MEEQISLGEFLPSLAMLWIVASLIIKISYKRQIQAEVHRLVQFILKYYETFGLKATLSPATAKTDAQAFVNWLDAQAATDTARKFGTTGYCMGGPIVMRTAATLPDRIGAGGSFHGGGLTADKPASPHNLIAKTQPLTAFLVAIADNDDAKEPDSKDILRATFAETGREAECDSKRLQFHSDTPHFRGYAGMVFRCGVELMKQR